MTCFHLIVNKSYQFLNLFLVKRYDKGRNISFLKWYNTLCRPPFTLFYNYINNYHLFEFWRQNSLTYKNLLRVPIQYYHVILRVKYSIFFLAWAIKYRGNTNKIRGKTPIKYRGKHWSIPGNTNKIPGKTPMKYQIKHQ